MTRVQATFKDVRTGEAIVTFDPGVAAVDALVTAVNEATGPLSPRQYHAEIKEGPRPVSAR